MKYKILLTLCLVLVLMGSLAVTYKKSIKSFVKDRIHYFKYGLKIKSNIMVPMRDGVGLATHVMLPPEGSGPYPALLLRTSYGSKNMLWSGFYARNGYAVVIQDVRGRQLSEGTYNAHEHARSDGYDTIDWIVEQQWSNGKVGSYGCSYAGEAQNMLAAAKHPNHVAMISDGAGGAIGSARGSYGYFGLFENGVFNLASGLGWFTERGSMDNRSGEPVKDYKQRIKEHINSLPVIDIIAKTAPYSTGYPDMLSHELTDPWWEQQGYISDRDTFSTAVLHVNSWFDQTAMDTFRLASLMHDNAINDRAKHQHLLIGPGTHCTSGLLKTGPLQLGEKKIHYTDIDYQQIYLDWFDYWLKGDDKRLPPAIRYYVINEDRWVSDKEWPPRERHKARFFLQRNATEDTGTLGMVMPEAGVPSTTYRYDPLDPVPTKGGPICCTGRAGDLAGMVRQNMLIEREDVLAYQTQPLVHPTALLGSAVANLFVSTDSPDTDFTVKLLDIQPDGTIYNLQDGVIRLRYRQGVSKPELAIPGEIYQIRLELRPIAYRFEKGHRIGIMISSSNFPRLARNLNTGEGEYNSARVMAAQNRLYHNADHASYLELPLDIIEQLFGGEQVTGEDVVSSETK